MGNLERGLPGRGRQPQRRLVGVGAEAGTDRKRRYLGCCNRPLPPLSRRLRAAARAEPERASAFHRVVTHRAVGGRVRFEADAPLPRRAGRATRAGHHADGHASPLHEPALVREQRRMDGQRRASGVSPIREPGRRRAWGPGRDLVHHQRTKHLWRERVDHGRVSARPSWGPARPVQGDEQHAPGS